MPTPKLRFKGYSSEWPESKLEDLGTFKKGKYLSKSDLSDSGVPCILYGQLYTIYNEIVRQVESVTNADIKLLYLSKGGEILFPCSDVTPTGIACASYLPYQGVALGGDIHVFNSKCNVSGALLSYILNSVAKQEILKIAQGSTVFHTSASDLKKISVNLPSTIEEQHKIAEFLSTVDEKVEALETKLEALNSLKKGFMQKIFSQELRFKDDSGQDYPPFRDTTIGEEGYFYYGKSAPKWSLTDDATTPCVRYGELYTTHKYQVKEIHSFTNIPVENLKLSKGGEVLIPRVGEEPLDFCKCAYLPFANVAIGEMISVYNTNHNPLFISYMFNATMKKEFAKRVEGGNVSNLYYYYLEDIKISVPCLEEQRKIAEFLSAFDEKIEAVKRQVEAMKQVKKGLLQQMFVQ